MSFQCSMSRSRSSASSRRRAWSSGSKASRSKSIFLRAARLGEGYVELALVLLRAGADDQSLSLELREHLREGGGAYAHALLQLALGELAPAVQQAHEDELLAAPPSRVHVQEVAEVAEAAQDASLDGLRCLLQLPVHLVFRGHQIPSSRCLT